ncbi:cystatin-A1-like [Kryptolebias marmoratus]|uniref:Cystatin-B n=1 Tax=Kryptolebias marmoratus TaxID=37003 RepID=A0A3Q3AA64_KRYMA|nr:cystatin-A1-like [Kryptolebias marmoratus]
MDSKFGGWSEVEPATDDIQKICDTVKSQVEGKTNRTYEEFKAVAYRKQVVSGMNYLIKVHVGGSDCLHIYVYQSPLQAGKTETKLKRVEQHKDEDPLDPILPYQ